MEFFYSSLFTFYIAILMHTDSVGTIFVFCLLVAICLAISYSYLAS